MRKLKEIVCQVLEEKKLARTFKELVWVYENDLRNGAYNQLKTCPATFQECHEAYDEWPRDLRYETVKRIALLRMKELAKGFGEWKMVYDIIYKREGENSSREDSLEALREMTQFVSGKFPKTIGGKI